MGCCEKKEKCCEGFSVEINESENSIIIKVDDPNKLESLKKKIESSDSCCCCCCC